jgi:hypothetical protein
MKKKNECIPIHWYQSECDEQPIGVLVQLPDGETQYLTIKEYNRFMNNGENIISEAYRNYLNTYSGNFEVDREEFIAASKRSPDFSQMWGLQFEERELTYSERYRYWFTHNYETGLEYDEGNIPDFDNTYYDPTPTRLITVTYKDEKIESYE